MHNGAVPFGQSQQQNPALPCIPAVVYTPVMKSFQTAEALAWKTHGD